jgi:hypothetical protein
MKVVSQMLLAAPPEPGSDPSVHCHPWNAKGFPAGVTEIGASRVAPFVNPIGLRDVYGRRVS